MTRKLISIVIPTCNREQQLSSLLTSIGRSTYKNYEIIVVNNGNKIQKPPTNIKIIQNTSNKGLAYARKKGAENAKGEYILFIDDDNVLETNTLSHLVETLENNKNFLAVGPVTYYKGNKNKIWFVSVKMNLFTTKPTFTRTLENQSLIKKRYIVTDNLHNCFMIRKADGEGVGWFDKEIFMNGTEFDLFMKLKNNYPEKLLVTDIKAKDYHDVPTFQSSFLRSLGFDTNLRVYYFQRNRGLLVKRYGTIFDKLSLFFIFYPIFFMIYSVLFVLYRKWDFLKSHIKATKDGYSYLLHF